MSEEESTRADASDAGIARAYDRWSVRYDRDANPTRDLDGVVLRAAELRVRGRDVLEIGCGTGKNTVWLAEQASSVIAMDFSEGMLAQARVRVTAANVRFVAHDVRRSWPLAAASVDVVTCNLVLEHVQGLAPIFGEAARVLRQGGELFICELHPFRQLLGGQARFEDAATGEATLVPAFRHTVSEFVNDGLASGLRLERLGEWIEEGAPSDAPPRLLSLRFERP